MHDPQGFCRATATAASYSRESTAVACNGLPAPQSAPEVAAARRSAAAAVQRVLHPPSVFMAHMWSEVRFGAGVAVLDGKLYAVGGRIEEDDDGGAVSSRCCGARWQAVCGGRTGCAGHNRLSSVERYDPGENVWEAVAPMATPRRASVVVLM